MLTSAPQEARRNCSGRSLSMMDVPLRLSGMRHRPYCLRRRDRLQSFPSHPETERGMARRAAQPSFSSKRSWAGSPRRPAHHRGVLISTAGSASADGVISTSSTVSQLLAEAPQWPRAEPRRRPGPCLRGTDAGAAPVTIRNYPTAPRKAAPCISTAPLPSSRHHNAS